MSDALTTGSERLGANLAGHPANEAIETSWNAGVISDDPGVKALVSFVKIAAALDEDSFIRNEAVAALKLWEHGS